MRMRASGRESEGTAWNSPRERTAEASSSPEGRSRVREVGACWDMMAVVRVRVSWLIEDAVRIECLRVDLVTLMMQMYLKLNGALSFRFTRGKTRDDRRRPRSGSRLLSHHTIRPNLTLSGYGMVACLLYLCLS